MVQLAPDKVLAMIAEDSGGSLRKDKKFPFEYLLA